GAARRCAFLNHMVRKELMDCIAQVHTHAAPRTVHRQLPPNCHPEKVRLRLSVAATLSRKRQTFGSDSLRGLTALPTPFTLRVWLFLLESPPLTAGHFPTFPAVLGILARAW